MRTGDTYTPTEEQLPTVNGLDIVVDPGTVPTGLRSSEGVGVIQLNPQK